MIKVDKTTLEQYREKIVEFIKEYTYNSGHKTGVVGLSGGVDSSLTYSLTCEALGEKNTIGVIMPYKTSKKSFKENAEKLAQLKGGRIRYHEITAIMDSFKDQFKNIAQARFFPKLSINQVEAKSARGFFCRVCGRTLLVSPGTILLFSIVALMRCIKIVKRHRGSSETIWR